MTSFRVILVLLVAICLNGCSNSELPYRQEKEAFGHLDSLSLSGMVKVSSFGKGVRLLDASKKTYETGLEVHFDYDFLIGEHEVTCSEMGMDCGKSLPAVNVTYYDAVLYANERSKAEGFDTVYSYVDVVRDGAGSCVNLEGLVFKPEVEGYRLPTEAEWVFAASHDWNVKNSWHNGNSDYVIHDVCSAFVSSLGLCDMAGNAMEWVNDWRIDVKDTSVSNFAGASDAGSFGERVVKGGCFRNAPGSISVDMRGDIYVVTSSFKADYLGFRLAFGAIEKPVWFSRNGGTTESPVSVVASASRVRRAVGMYRSKLAFRNDITGNIAFVDYHTGELSITEIKDTINAYHPDISPDGNRVAFCTGLEGVNGKSSLYVRNLDSAGTGLVRLRAGNAAIPRWRVLEDGDTAITYVTYSGNNRDSAWKKAETWQVSFSKGQFGVPYKLFSGAYHGGVALGDSLAVTGARSLRARVKNTSGKFVDTVWYAGEQACNASLSRTESARTLFLDFASPTGRSFVGKSYNAHEVAFVADRTGKLLRSVDAPEGYAFNHTEWAGKSDSLFVATLTDVNGSHGSVVLVNSRDGNSMTLLQGKEIWHPAMWNDLDMYSEGASLEVDSAGLYYVDYKENHVLSMKMPLFWHAIDSIEVIGFGNSRMQFGINPMRLKDHYMFNMGMVPCDINMTKYLLTNYVLPHCKKLEYVVIGIDPDMWSMEDSTWSIRVTVDDVPGFIYDIDHDFWKEGVSDEFLYLVDNNVHPDIYFNSYKKNRGWTPLIGSEGWMNGTDAIEIVYDTVGVDKEPTLEQNFRTLKSMVNLCKQRGIKVIGLTAPMCPCYKETGAYGRYGLKRSQAQKFFEKLKAYDESEDNFVFMDENKMGNHDYPLDVGYDVDHINYTGSFMLTDRLDSLLKAF